MEEKSTATLEKIQQAAMEEFSEKGFQGASLRQIVKQAGVTTGAFYGYFSSKEALFASIVQQGGALCLHRGASRRCADGPVHGGTDRLCRDARAGAAGTHGTGVQPVRPLDGGLHLRPPGEGTSYEHFVHNMVEVEVEYTLQYLEVLHRLGHESPQLDAQLCHIIASGMFNGIFEIVVHDMPKEQAMHYVDQLRDFYTAGWLKLIGQ